MAKICMMVTGKIIALTNGVFNVYRCNYTHDANTHMIITMYTGEGKSLSRV